MIETLISAITLIAGWVVYSKMGIEGWKSLIPFYGSYVLFEKLYGDGWKFVLLIIPIYGIYVWFKLWIDLAKEFNQESVYGVGLALVYPVFISILAFGPAKYKDGSYADENDILANAVNQVKDKINGKETENSSDVYASIKKLEKLHEDGLITDEEYIEKREELLKRL